MSRTATPLLETEPGRTLLLNAEERGYVEPAEFEAFVAENDVTEDDVAELREELDALGVQIAEAAKEELDFTPDTVPGAGDSLQLFLADIGRHKLLTAAEEVTLAKRIEKGDPIAKRTMIESNLRLVVSGSSNVAASL